MNPKKPNKSKATGKSKPARTAGPKLVRRTPRSPRTPFASEDLHQQIAARAYEFYELRSRLGPLDDWLMAETEILERETKRS